MRFHIPNRIKRAIRELLGQPSAAPCVVTANIQSVAPNELLKGRTALVTGGSSGIGYSIAKAFLMSGASVIITGRNAEKLEKACTQLRSNISSPGQLLQSHVMDMCDVQNMAGMFSDIVAELDNQHPLDILVNNAGIGNGGGACEAAYDIVMNTDLKGPWFLTQIVAEHMKAQGIPGNILNIASSSSERPAFNPYCLAKWGIKAMTYGYAKKCLPHKIVVNAIAPGVTATPMHLKSDCNNIAEPRNPLGRCATAEEIANMAVFLVSGMGRTIVGDIIHMSGGAGLITYDDVDYHL